MGLKTVLTALVVGIGATQATAAAPSFFPLADGNRWTLRGDGAGETNVSVGPSQAPGFVLRGFPGTGQLRVRAVGSAVEAWDAGSNRWEPFLRLGARGGTKYGVNLSGAPLWRSVVVTVASRQAVVHDARGKTLRGCVKLTLSHPKGVADAGIEELAFAPGIGLVRVSEITIAGVRERVLASFKL